MSNKGSANGERPISELRFPEFEGLPIHTVCLGDVTEEPSARNHGHLPSEFVMGVRKDDGIVPMEERLVGADTTRYKVVKNNWFAYNPMRLNIGSIARWQGQEDVLVSPDYVVFRCLQQAKPTRLLPSYLDQFRRAKQWDSFVNGSGDGGVRVRVYYRDLARLQLSLPDVSEQSKIAACLSSIDGLIDSEAEKLNQLRKFRLGLSQHLFPLPGEAKPRLRFPEFQGTGDWQWAPLGENLDTVTPPKKLPTSEYKQQGKFPIIDQSQSIVAGWTDDAGSVIGEPLPVVVFGDHTCTLKLVDFPFAQGADGIKIIVPNEKMTVEYLHGALQAYPVHSGDYKRHFTDLKQKAVAFPDIQTGEQQMIASCLLTIDELIRAQNDRVETLDSHKAALMQQLFPTQENS